MNFSRPALLLVLCLLIQGCAHLSLPWFKGHSPNSPQGLFLQSLDEFDTSDDSPSLARLRFAYPQSPWTEKATELAELFKSRRQLARQNQLLEQKLTTSERKNSEVEKELSQLKSDLQRMKDVVVEMELRSK